MLCSKCFKKIPEGEEVQRASSFYWNAGWARGGGGSEVVCKRCAIKIRKGEKTLLIIFLSIWFCTFAGSIIVWAVLACRRGS